MTAPISTHDHRADDLPATLEFLKRARWELRELRKVHVWIDRFSVLDVNGDYIEVRGVGYPDADIVPLLTAVNAAFDPQTVHAPIAFEYKEFFTGRRDAWAANRAM